jgi:hypothetical protein
MPLKLSITSCVYWSWSLSGCPSVPAIVSIQKVAWTFANGPALEGQQKLERAPDGCGHGFEQVAPERISGVEQCPDLHEQVRDPEGLGDQLVLVLGGPVGDVHASHTGAAGAEGRVRGDA